MRGHPAYKHCEKSDAVEQARQQHREECELRLARAMNTLKEKVNTPWPEGQKTVYAANGGQD